MNLREFFMKNVDSSLVWVNEVNFGDSVKVSVSEEVANRIDDVATGDGDGEAEYARADGRHADALQPKLAHRFQ